MKRKTESADWLDKQRVRDMNAISDILKEDLVVEIIYTAMRSLRGAPDDTVEEAISFGFNEWVK